MGQACSGDRDEEGQLCLSGRNGTMPVRTPRSPSTMTARDWLERFEQEVGQVPTVGQLINFVKERLGEISEQAAEACLRLRNQKVTEGGSSMSHIKDNAHEVDMVTPMSIVIFGATGDLAKKKLYPAVYQPADVRMPWRAAGATKRERGGLRTLSCRARRLLGEAVRQRQGRPSCSFC
ncbi:unnamed protein product [Prorocentrum cordatum]|uniref:Glucose-6-phosphate dehydrogenase NAD-binding domain-containing protein n=1 Tax=Prorocentrum cordatum TaxID=2364126 RepID=A0ABN9SG22_9DINO|nr:unnamed protein product [Polarella glacialis]